MRADRLIAILLMLQRRGRMSAAAMARELEVSRRTVMRDLEALGAAGVPIYSVRGRDGGYALWEGFRTQITGLTATELRSLPLWGAPEHAALFGLSEARVRARDKMAMRLPADMQDALGWIDQRLLSDPVPLDGRDRPAAVATLANAIANDRAVRLGSKGTVAYPLALIDNAGTWYVVADVEGQRMVRPVADLEPIQSTSRRFHRPEHLDLAGIWRAARQAFAAAPRDLTEVTTWRVP